MLYVRFIRHAESLANVGAVTAEPHSISLTPRGRQQAKAISQSFEAAPDLIIMSPYLRTCQTAEPTIARFPHVPVEVWPVQEIEMLAIVRRINTTPQERRPLIDEYWSRADPDFVDGAGAESYRAFIGRVRNALARLTELTECKRIIIFAHEQFMKGVLLEIADPGQRMDRDAMQTFYEFHHTHRIANGEGFAISWNGSQWIGVANRDGFDANTGTE